MTADEHGLRWPAPPPSSRITELERALKTPPAERDGQDCHGLDTPERVCFYEQDFYVLSNFSAFMVRWKGRLFATSEQAYHWEKFPDNQNLRSAILMADSAHAAFKLAEAAKDQRRGDWDRVKVEIMLDILRAKAAQHEYVRRKLLATGDRELVENSWRDDFWGWGPNRDGKNMLGRLWMEVRAELRAEQPHARGHSEPSKQERPSDGRIAIRAYRWNGDLRAFEAWFGEKCPVDSGGQVSVPSGEPGRWLRVWCGSWVVKHHARNYAIPDQFFGAFFRPADVQPVPRP